MSDIHDSGDLVFPARPALTDRWFFIMVAGLKDAKTIVYL
jgi:hypothetical protein